MSDISKKIIVIAIAAALVGGFFGSLATASLARADVFGNIWDFLTGKTAT
jgi:hypothetical protein